MKKASLLIVDDHRDFAESLLRNIQQHFAYLEIEVAFHAQSAETLAIQKHPTVILLDLELDQSLGTQSGFTLLQSLRKASPRSRIIILTGHDSPENGFRSLELGASSFLSKPPRYERLLALIEDARSLEELRSKAPSSKESFFNPKLLGRSPAFQKLQEEIELASSCELNVLLLGESGVGKNLVAKCIHDRSPRCDNIFCRSQPFFGSGELAHSELFGHRKGAFTGATEDRKGLFELASQGSLLLDECSELPESTQIALLDSLQSKRFRPLGSSVELQSKARIFSASNANLGQRLNSGRFRYDLFYRLSQFIIRVPSLRERLEDLPLIAMHALRSKDALGFENYDIAPSLLSHWQTLPWPGNIRELEHRVFSAALRAQQRRSFIVEIQDDHSLHELAPVGEASTQSSSFHEQVHTFKLELIRDALEKYQGNQTQAAQSLGLDRSSFRRILLGNRSDKGNYEPEKKLTHT